MFFFVNAANLNTDCATIFCPEHVICFLRLLSAAYIKVHFRLDFFHGSKVSNMNPDQTASLGAV